MIAYEMLLGLVIVVSSITYANGALNSTCTSNDECAKKIDHAECCDYALGCIGAVNSTCKNDECSKKKDDAGTGCDNCEPGSACECGTTIEPQVEVDNPIKTCQCKEGFIMDGTLTQCFKIATIYNDECLENSQCSQFLKAGGYCDKSEKGDKGRCVCKDGYHYLHGSCHESKGLNDTCEKDEDCFVHAPYQAVQCKENRCSCSDGYYTREYSTCRKSAKKDRDPCLIDADCNYSDKAKCIEKVCKSEDNKEQNNEISKQSKKINKRSVGDESSGYFFGGSCEQNPKNRSKTCGYAEHLFCDFESKCTCDRAHFPSNDKKKCVPEIGEQCDESDTNKVLNSECANGQWTCTPLRAALKNNQRCLELEFDIGKCTYDEQCQLQGPYSKCVNNKCECDSKTHFVKDLQICWTSKKLEEECRHNNDCFVPQRSPKPSCLEIEAKSTCACPEGSKMSNDSSFCVWEVDKAELETYCMNDEHCKVTSSFCNTTINSCKCSAGFVPLNNTCLKECNLDEECVDDAQCKVQNSQCFLDNTNTTAEETTTRHCKCKDDFYADSNSCPKKKWLGSACSKDDECFAKNTPKVHPVCDESSKKCICGPGTTEAQGKCNGASILQNNILASAMMSIFIMIKLA